MRWMFLLLLLVNILYFGWEFDRQTRMDLGSAASAYSIPRGAKRLALIRELPAPPPLRELPEPDVAPEAGSGTGQTEVLVAKLPDIAVPDVAGDPAQSASCFTFGPIPEERQAVGLSDWFRSRRMSVGMRHEEDRSQQLFWIYLAPVDSREGAMATIRDLQSKGISDYRLIARGDLQNAISLGLFSTQAAVNERLGELRDKGYKPVVVPYSDIKRIYWVDARIMGNSGIVEQIFQGYPSQFSSVPVKCDQIALATGAP